MSAWRMEWTASQIRGASPGESPVGPPENRWIYGHPVCSWAIKRPLASAKTRCFQTPMWPKPPFTVSLDKGIAWKMLYIDHRIRNPHVSKSKVFLNSSCRTSDERRFISYYNYHYIYIYNITVDTPRGNRNQY